MYCYIPGDGVCSTTIEVRAADGTSCGNKKWCMRGRCEYNRDAPQTAGKGNTEERLDKKKKDKLKQINVASEVTKNTSWGI